MEEFFCLCILNSQDEKFCSRRFKIRGGELVRAFLLVIPSHFYGLNFCQAVKTHFEIRPTLVDWTWSYASNMV